MIGRLRSVRALLAAVWCALASLLVLAPSAHAGTAYSVAMSNYAFAPASITVHAGDSVSWTNHDQAPHNIVTTSAPQQITSPTMSDGQSWSYTFTTPGTYHYICGVHPDMHGTVMVLATAPVPSTPAAAQPPAAAGTHVAAAPMPAMSGMSPASSPHATSSAPSAQKPSAAAAPARGSVAAAPTTPPVAVAAVSAGAPSTARIKPLLLVAGVVAAVTVFCLLVLAAPQPPPLPTDQR